MIEATARDDDDAPCLVWLRKPAARVQAYYDSEEREGHNPPLGRFDDATRRKVLDRSGGSDFATKFLGCATSADRTGRTPAPPCAEKDALTKALAVLDRCLVGLTEHASASLAYAGLAAPWLVHRPEQFLKFHQGTNATDSAPPPRVHAGDGALYAKAEARVQRQLDAVLECGDVTRPASEPTPPPHGDIQLEGRRRDFAEYPRRGRGGAAPPSTRGPSGSPVSANFWTPGFVLFCAARRDDARFG